MTWNIEASTPADLCQHLSRLSNQQDTHVQIFAAVWKRIQELETRVKELETDNGRSS